MSKKQRRGQQPRERANPDDMASEIRTELRGIFRRMDELCRPIVPELVEGVLEGEPRYSLRKMAAHESIQEEVIALAGIIWHLKDRLKRWISAAKIDCQPAIEEIAAADSALLICGDLIDSKKHGGRSNRSGYAPCVGEIGIRPNGKMGIKYDGALKLSEIRVMNPDPVSFTVEIITGDGKGTLGPAMDVVRKAFEPWRVVIDELDLLGASDGESVQLRRLMDRFKNGLIPICRSQLID
jgi:hypothetical protein